MKNTAAVLLTALLASACTGSSPVGYVEMPRVYAESKVARQASDEILRDTAALKKDVEDADVALKKVEADKESTDSQVRGARDKRDQASQTYKSAVKQRDDVSSDRIARSVRKVADDLARTHRLALVLSVNDPPLYAAVGVDLTAEVIAKLDADQGSSAKEVTALRAELEQLKKQVGKESRQ